jgi:hypothetical protein
MHIRLRFKKLGGHFHCRLFTAEHAHTTYAKCGDLVFSEREWPEVRRTFADAAKADVIPEEGCDYTGTELKR